MNQNLTKLGAQLRDIWRQLGNAQRLSVLCATFVLVAGLGTLVFWSSRGDYSLLYGRLSDGEAAKVIAAVPRKLRRRRLISCDIFISLSRSNRAKA